MHGILIATPWAFATPSQSPVPVGLTPGEMPNCGTRLGSTPRLESLRGPADTDTRAAKETKAVLINFMMNVESDLSVCVKIKECEGATVELFTDRRNCDV